MESKGRPCFGDTSGDLAQGSPLGRGGTGQSLQFPGLLWLSRALLPASSGRMPGMRGRDGPRREQPPAALAPERRSPTLWDCDFLSVSFLLGHSVVFYSEGSDLAGE